MEDEFLDALYEDQWGDAYGLDDYGWDEYDDDEDDDDEDDDDEDESTSIFAPDGLEPPF